MPTRTEGGAATAARHARSAFGLRIDSSLLFEGRPHPFPHGQGTAAVVEAVAPAALDRHWPRQDGALVMERRNAAGRFLEIEHHAERGYRISAPGYGAYLVSRDGRRVLAAVPPDGGWQWQRLFFAQVLPLASALQGFALFHASAVAIDGRGCGFAAASGTGKTSLAAHLLVAGAHFITDDVLALGTGPTGVHAYPGAGMLAVHPAELAVLSATERAALGRVMGDAGKTYFAREPVSTPLPLSALYYLVRGRSVERFSIALRSPDPRVLLAGAFLSYLQDAGHLRSHLEACAQIAGEVPVFELRIPPGVSSPEVAERVAEHAAGACA